MKKKIGIVCGGFSGEAAVSMKSAQMILDNIDRGKYEVYQIVIEKKHWYAIIGGEKADIDRKDFSFQTAEGQIRPDACLVIIHGTPGEDGKLQGYFDMIDMPYTTGSVLNLSLTFDKRSTNDALSARGFNVAKNVFLNSPEEYDERGIIEKLGLPLFVKPNQGGSSLGITKVKEVGQLKKAVQDAYDQNSSILIEEFLDGREFTCGVVCRKHESTSLAVTEIITEREFFDYQAKYDLDRTQEITPADLPSELYEKCLDLTVRIAESVKCKGVVRVDYKLVGEEFYVIEINTIPGMSLASLVPKQAESVGINKTQLIDLIVDSAFQ
jgi:D-alanine-D-alanine ligase